MLPLMNEPNMHPDALADMVWNEIGPRETIMPSSPDGISISELSDKIFLHDRPLDYDSSSEESSGVMEDHTRTVSQDLDGSGNEEKVDAKEEELMATKWHLVSTQSEIDNTKAELQRIQTELLQTREHTKQLSALATSQETTAFGTFIPVEDTVYQVFHAPSSPMKRKVEEAEDLTGRVPMKKRTITRQNSEEDEEDNAGQGGGLTPTGVWNPIPLSSSTGNSDFAQMKTIGINLCDLQSTLMSVMPLKNISVYSSFNDGISTSVNKMNLVTPMKRCDVSVTHDNEEKKSRPLKSCFISDEMEFKVELVPTATTEKVGKEKLASHSLPLLMNEANVHQTTTSANIPVPTIRSQDENWAHMFRALQEFKKQYGHTDVKQQWAPNPKLAIWVNTQRTTLKKWLDTKGNKETKGDMKKRWRVDTLKSIGFDFSIGKGRHGKRTRVIPEYNKKSWEDQFTELVKYKEIHGDCKVKLLDPNYKSLGRWVGNQRKKYREYFIAQQEQGLVVGERGGEEKTNCQQEGSQEHITGDQDLVMRFNRLKDLGFVFVIRKQKKKA